MKKTILIAEDHAVCRALAREYLLREGFAVVEAANGFEAVEKYMRAPQEIDLMILDILMPGMNGKDVYEKIAESGNACPVLFCSGFSGDKLGSDFMLKINCDLLKKPYMGEELIARVRALLETGGK